MSAEIEAMACRLRHYEDAVLTLAAHSETRPPRELQDIDRATQTAADLALALRVVSSEVPPDIMVPTQPLEQGLKLADLRACLLAPGYAGTYRAGQPGQVEVF
ncbi:MAG: hypothetical protein EP307_11265 [Rhodobacteraceae bacterium]|nr:MAG: hypothetical protein EP307_11265 [Paracoccaceae bacterium]